MRTVVQALRVITLTPFAWLLPRPCAAAGVCGGFAVPLCTWYLWYQDCGHQYVLGVGLVPSEFQFQQVPPPQFRCAALCCTAVHTAGGLLQATAHQPQISRCPACACVPMHRMRIQVDYGTLLPFVIQQNCECIRAQACICPSMEGGPTCLHALRAASATLMLTLHKVLHGSFRHVLHVSLMELTQSSCSMNA
eukprot:364848-Chlamydomonas_euryale.AAC.19